jgi:hypothetical protein
MKFLKLLAVPAALFLTVLVAVPAFAHTFDKGKLDSACDKTNGQICLTLSGSIETGFDARTVVLELVGVKGTTETPLTGNTVTFKLPANHSNSAVSFGPKKECFMAVTTGNFDSFTVKVISVTDTVTSKAADIDMQLTVNGATTMTQVQFPSQTPVTVITGLSLCTATSTPTPMTPSPSSSGGNGGGSPTPSANTTVALAQTGGFDFRFPLIGLVLLVAGGALFVVSASRGRSADTK